MIDVPAAAVAAGFLDRPAGTHTSRTIMLPELRLLLAACPPNARFEDYRSAVVGDNALRKPTVDTRRRTVHYLRDRYGLDPRVLLFRAMRDLWDDDEAAQPLLAMLCAVGRDPLLRASAEIVLAAPPGAVVTAGMLAGAIAASVPGRYNPETLITTGQRAGASWVQSGHLAMSGRHKVRARAASGPAAAAYALVLGHLCDVRGGGLLGSFWARLLDAPIHALREQAGAASRQGWIDYRHAGAVTEVGFGFLLRDREAWL